MITVLSDIYPAVERFEILQWLRLPEGSCGQSENALLDTLASSATVAIEERLKRKMVSAEILKEAKHWSRKIPLPWSPLIQIESFEYVDKEGATVTVDNDLYEVIENARPAYIRFKDSLSKLPDLNDDMEYPIQIRYTVGEASEAINVPKNYKQAILMAVASGYMNRASLSSKTLQTEAMEHYINQILMNKRVMRFG